MSRPGLQRGLLSMNLFDVLVLVLVLVTERLDRLHTSIESQVSDGYAIHINFYAYAISSTYTCRIVHITFVGICQQAGTSKQVDRRM